MNSYFAGTALGDGALVSIRSVLMIPNDATLMDYDTSLLVPTWLFTMVLSVGSPLDWIAYLLLPR